MTVEDCIDIKPAGDEYQVFFNVGNQHFRIGMSMSKEEANWYANQFKTALKKLITKLEEK